MLCTLVSVCPSVHLFGQNWRLNLGTFSLIYIVNSKSCRHYSSKTVRRSILIFIYVIPNILKLCTLVSVCPSVRLIGQNWRLNLGNFSLIYIVNSKSCRHYSSETVRRSILIFIYVIPNILMLCTLVSVGPFNWPKLTFELSNFSLIYIVNTKSCRHYSPETVWRSILIFIYAVPNILKLCTLVSVCPSVRLIGQRLNLGHFSHLTLVILYLHSQTPCFMLPVYHFSKIILCHWHYALAGHTCSDRTHF